MYFLVWKWMLSFVLILNNVITSRFEEQNGDQRHSVTHGRLLYNKGTFALILIQYNVLMQCILLKSTPVHSICCGRHGYLKIQWLHPAFWMSHCQIAVVRSAVQMSGVYNKCNSLICCLLFKKKIWGFEKCLYELTLCLHNSFIVGFFAIQFNCISSVSESFFRWADAR